MCDFPISTVFMLYYVCSVNSMTPGNMNVQVTCLDFSNFLCHLIVRQYALIAQNPYGLLQVKARGKHNVKAIKMHLPLGAMRVSDHEH